MTLPDGSGQDEDFEARLCDLDDAIAHGIVPSRESGTDTLDDSLTRRLTRAQRCLLLLESLRRIQFGPAAEEPRPARAGDEQPGFPGASVQVSVDRFAIVRELGRGGHGVVLLAVDPRLNRLVALKLPHPEALFSPDLKARFLREARAAASLSHPHVVAIHDLGEHGAVCWIAAEYCPGASLADWLAERPEPQDPRTAARIVAQLAGAVQHAHERNVLHRDLKPSNVLLTPSETRDVEGSPADQGLAALTPKLTDFGLAKILEAQSDQTKTGVALGTPSYMPPEQVELSRGSVGPASDIYGLGAILYELLAGRPPFRGATAADTLRQVLLDEPRAIRRIRADVPADLEAICFKCLEKRPERRYATASELASDLHRFLAGEPTRARPLGPAARLLRWSQRRRLLVLLIALCVVGGIGALTGIALHRQRLDREVSNSQRLQMEVDNHEQRLVREKYVTDMRLARRAWQEGNLAHMVGLLEAHRPGAGRPDDRDFVWHWLWRLSHRQQATCAGHQDEVSAVAFSPRGEYLATASWDSAVRLFETATGRLKHEMRGHQGHVDCMLFTPDWGIISGAENGEIKLWDAERGQLIRTISAHEGDVSCLSLHPDRRTLASGGGDKAVRLWDVKTGESLKQLDGHASWVRGAAFSPPGHRLASVDYQGMVRFWDSATWSCLATTPTSLKAATAIAFHPDGSIVAVAGTDGRIALVDAQTFGVVSTFKAQDAWLRTARFSANGKVLACAGNSGSVTYHNIEQRERPELIAEWPAHTGRVWACDYSPDGDLLATASGDRTVKLWNWGEDNDFESSLQFERRLDDPVVSSDGSMLVASGIAEFHVWDWPSGRKRGSIPNRSTGLGRFAVSFDGRRIAFAGDSVPIELWDLQRLTKLTALSAPSSGSREFAFTPDGAKLFALNGDITIQSWDLPSGHTHTEMHVAEGETLGHLTISPDGQTLAATSRDELGQRTILWNLPTERERVRLQGACYCVAFSPDSRLLASGAADHAVRVWDVEHGVERLRLLGHREDVKALSFSCDGKLLAGIAQHGPVIIWDLASGAEVLRLSEPRPHFDALFFSPDRKSLIAKRRWIGRTSDFVVFRTDAQ